MSIWPRHYTHTHTHTAVLNYKVCMYLQIDPDIIPYFQEKSLVSYDNSFPLIWKPYTCSWIQCAYKVFRLIPLALGFRKATLYYEEKRLLAQIQDMFHNYIIITKTITNVILAHQDMLFMAGYVIYMGRY